MLTHLSAFDAGLWLVIAACQILLAIIVHRTTMERHYPAFSLFVYFAALKTVALLSISSRYALLFAGVYYAVSLMASVLMALVVGEIYYKVFGPRLALPEGTPRSVALWLAAAVTCCVILAVVLRPTHGGPYTTILGAIQAALVSGLSVSMWILAGYSRWLGISWRPHVAGIAVGIVLSLSIHTITLFVGGLSSRPTAELARRVGQLAYLLSLAWWGWALWEKEPVPEKATPEMVRAVLSGHQETMEAANQMLEELRS